MPLTKSAWGNHVSLKYRPTVLGQNLRMCGIIRANSNANDRSRHDLQPQQVVLSLQG